MASLAAPASSDFMLACSVLRRASSAASFGLWTIRFSGNGLCLAHEYVSSKFADDRYQILISSLRAASNNTGTSTTRASSNWSVGH
jgi:hypothetical protein